MIRVAFISYDFGDYSVQMANGLSHEATVCLFLPTDLAEPYAEEVDPRIQKEFFHKPRLRQPLLQLKTIFWIFRKLRKFKPDVVHIQQGHLWLNLSLHWLRQYPLVITIHDHEMHVGDQGARNTPQKVYDGGFQRADQLVVHAAEMKKALQERLPILTDKIHAVPMVAHRLDVQHSTLNANDGTRAPASTESIYSNPQILFFGRIWAYKGLDYLIRTQPIINAQLPNVQFVIAGEGEDFARYRQMMVDPEKFTVYNEYISNEKRDRLFEDASIVVLPYIEATQSGVIPVAYSFAKPVIATRVGGIPSLIEHRETGILVPPRDESALAQAILMVLQDDSLRQRLGENGYQKVHTELSPMAVAEKILPVYKLAIQRKSRAR